MFSDLNPQGLPTAIIEIAAMLAGAFLIGFLSAWLFHRARAASKRDKDLSTTLKASKSEKNLKAAQTQWEQKINHLELEKKSLSDQIKQWETQKAAWEKERATFSLEQSAWAKEKSELLKEKSALAASSSMPSANTPDNYALLQTKDAEIQSLKDEAAEFQAVIDKINAERDAMMREQAQKEEELRILLDERQRWALETQSPSPPNPDPETIRMIEENAQLKSSLMDIKRQMEEIDQEIKRKEAESQARLDELEKSRASMGNSQGDEKDQELANWRKQAEEKQKEAQQLRERMRELQDKSASSGLGGEAVVQLREKLKLAEEESEGLKTKLQQLESQIAEPTKVESDSLNTRIIHKLTQERDQLRKELDLLRAAPTLDSADDLTQIPGITPELQTKLYAQGIRTFAALSEISELDRIRLDRELNLAPGTIKAQKWIKKARELRG